MSNPLIVSEPDVRGFYAALSARVDRGERLVASLTAVAGSTTNAALTGAIADVATRLSGGETLSQAMTAHPSVFAGDDLTVVKRGEMTGRLDDALRLLA